ncbi:MAG: signal recognition particle-docking protein FtsY [Bacillota bacterium]|nr:signal recognition particle-docking protein FtsY [Bacillota bacterium]
MAFFDRFKGKKKNENEDELIQAEEVTSEKEELEEQEEGHQMQELPSNEDESGTGEEESAEAAEEINDDADESSEKKGLFERLKTGLNRTRQNFSGKIGALIKNAGKLDDDFYEELEDILIQADVGMTTSMELVDKIRSRAKKNKINDPNEVSHLIEEEISSILGSETVPLNIVKGELTVIMVVGVNGAGKTTTIAKLAHRFKKDKKKVLLAAGDTFRAAAIDQLQIWADRVGVDLIKHQEGADPGAVVFDAINAARARKADILIIDTAGRLQNKTNLMKEISKVRKVIEREISDAPHEVLLLLDATTGQNAISQAKIFGEATGVTGIVLSKLDGTAKGGIVIAVNRELDIPVKLVGIGEGMEDLKDFSPELFAQALFEE